MQQLLLYCFLRNLPPSALPAVLLGTPICRVSVCLSAMLLLLLQRGIDVLMNKESKRETPAVVSFGDKMRFIGTDGAGKISMNPKNTPHQLKRLLGKQFKDPAVQVGWGRPGQVSTACLCACGGAAAHRGALKTPPPAPAQQ